MLARDALLLSRSGPVGRDRGQAAGRLTCVPNRSRSTVKAIYVPTCRPLDVAVMPQCLRRGKFGKERGVQFLQSWGTEEALVKASHL